MNLYVHVENSQWLLWGGAVVDPQGCHDCTVQCNIYIIIIISIIITCLSSPLYPYRWHPTTPTNPNPYLPSTSYMICIYNRLFFCLKSVSMHFGRVKWHNISSNIVFYIYFRNLRKIEVNFLYNVLVLWDQNACLAIF